MNPDHSNEQNCKATAYLCPTSPWTEPFQNAQQAEHAERATYNSEDQRPTHDALSDIYNRGYE